MEAKEEYIALVEFAGVSEGTVLTNVPSEYLNELLEKGFIGKQKPKQSKAKKED